jgi:DNA-binding NtrC family response regulator
MAQAMKIAIVDDEEDMRQSISQWLTLSGFQTEVFSGAEHALRAIEADYPGIVVTDIRMPSMDGMAMLKKLMSQDASLPVIMITGHGDVPMAVEAMRVGAYDFLEKPFNPDRMAELAKRAIHTRRLTLENRALRRELSDGTILLRKLMGSSAEMARLREDILDLAQADGHVFIDGETGTGKSLVAHALHACGARQGKRFVTFSCAAHGPSEIEAMLFGPLEGADRPAVEEARAGTLCLEDIEALPDQAQARLLAVLNAQNPDDPASVRVIAICNEPDPTKSSDSSLRPALYFRLSALHVTLPPLRKRGEDILQLFNRFLEIFAEEYGCSAPDVSAKEAAELLQAPWPGNVRQLINLSERAVLQNRREASSITSLLLADNSETAEAQPTEGKPLKEYVEAFERMLIDNTMRRHRGSIAAVMEELSLPRRTLNEKMAKYGLSRSDYL